MRLSSGFWAIAGAVVTGLSLMGGQIVVQRHEDLRNLHMLAYNVAMEEWKTIVDTAVKKEVSFDNVPIFRKKLMEHLMYVAMIHDYGPDAVSEGRGKALWKIFMDEYGESYKEINPQAGNNGSDNHPNDGKAP